jgi:hypothetical protein
VFALSLKFYDTENKIFSVSNAILIPESETLKICNKLARHYKFEFNGFKCKKMSKTLGRALFKDMSCVFRPNENALLTICHELAHLWQFDRTNKSRHDKKLLRKIGILLTYCYENESIVYILRKRCVILGIKANEETT